MKTKLNVRLLRRIKRHILAEPKRFQMDASVLVAKTQKEWMKEIVWANDASKIRPPCGTAACIAGWADVLTNGIPDDFELGGVRHRAATALGVDAGISWTSHPLFYARNWPEPFASKYSNAKRPSTRAKIAADRIDHLIKTGE